MRKDVLMRVSPVGYLFDDLETIYSETATISSHDSTLAIVSVEAYYGVPNNLKQQALSKSLDNFVLKLNEDYQKIKKL